MRRERLVRVEVLSAAKMWAVLTMVMGLVTILLTQSISAAWPGAVLFLPPGAIWLEGIAHYARGEQLPLIVILMLTVLYAVWGFISGLILAVTYNYAAQWMGGVIFEKETVADEETPGAGI
jgi:hypothetical protein